MTKVLSLCRFFKVKMKIWFTDYLFVETILTDLIEKTQNLTAAENILILVISWWKDNLAEPTYIAKPLYSIHTTLCRFYKHAAKVHQLHCGWFGVKLKKFSLNNRQCFDDPCAINGQNSQEDMRQTASEL